MAETLDDRSPLVISGVGAFTFAGEGPDAVVALLDEGPVPVSEEVELGRRVSVGRIGRVRNHPFSARYDRFGQIDTFSRYAFVAAGHALDDAGLDAPDEALEDTGVILGTAFGCQEANWQFDQFTLDPAVGLRGASPMAFKGTVDNAPAGWVAVAYQLKGVNATYVSGPGAGGEDLLAAADAVATGRAPRVVAGGVERLIELQIAALYRDDEAPRPFAAEGAVLAVIEDADAARRRGHRPRARLLAGRRLPPGPRAVASLLDDAGVDPAGLSGAAVAAARPATLDALRGDLRALGCAPPAADDAEGAGQMYAAAAPLSLQLTIHRLARAGGGTGLVLAAGEGDERFAFLVRVD